MHERQEGRANTEYSVNEEDLLLDLRSCQVIRSSLGTLRSGTRRLLERGG